MGNGLVKYKVVVGIVDFSVAVLFGHAPVGIVSDQSEPERLLESFETSQEHVEHFLCFLLSHVHKTRVHFNANLLNVIENARFY